jgi:hypothetical protein
VKGHTFIYHEDSDQPYSASDDLSLFEGWRCGERRSTGGGADWTGVGGGPRDDSLELDEEEQL